MRETNSTDVLEEFGKNFNGRIFVQHLTQTTTTIKNTFYGSNL